MSRLKDMKIKIGISNPLETALAYMERVIKSKEEWPIERVMAIRRILAELDEVMVEIANNSVNASVLDDKEE